MSQSLPSPHCCDTPCEDAPAEQLVGPQGKSAYQIAVDEGFVGTEAEWLASIDGAAGQNSFTDLTAAFTVPDAAVPASATVDNSDWAVIGQIVFLEGAGYFTVTSVPDSTHVVLDNTDYPGNAADGTIIAIGSHLVPAGLRGAAGAGGGGGDMIGANNLSDVASPATSRTNLGLGTMAVEVAADYLSKAGNLSGLANAATARTNLGVAIGTDVQAYDADLATWAALTPSANAQSLITAADYAAMLVLLGKVLPRFGLLAFKVNVNFNIAANDNAITVASNRYRIDRITVDNASVSLTTATLGVFTAPAAGGTTVMTDQGLAALNATTKFTDPALAGIVATDVLTDSVLYLRTGTPQGSAATGNVWIFGWDLS